MYKAWLTKCISEIQTIVPGTPRIRVNQLLYLDGGVFSPSAARYLHSDCGVLKVRIQFETDPSNNNLDYFGSKNDKVIAISIPYLGWPAYD